MINWFEKPLENARFKRNKTTIIRFIPGARRWSCWSRSTAAPSAPCAHPKAWAWDTGATSRRRCSPPPRRPASRRSRPPRTSRAEQLTNRSNYSNKNFFKQKNETRYLPDRFRTRTSRGAGGNPSLVAEPATEEPQPARHERSAGAVASPVRWCASWEPNHRDVHDSVADAVRLVSWHPEARKTGGQTGSRAGAAWKRLAVAAAGPWDTHKFSLQSQKSLKSCQISYK